ncbi:hypothetical protein D3C71_1681120 [compost metagenome]
MLSALALRPKVIRFCAAASLLLSVASACCIAGNSMSQVASWLPSMQISSNSNAAAKALGRGTDTPAVFSSFHIPRSLALFA